MRCLVENSVGYGLPSSSIPLHVNFQHNLELWGADVGNAYLQALTREKLSIVGGPEFEELQGHVLVMYKALYGTRSGGACWHDKFFDILHHMGFKPSRADPDIWMKSSKDGSHYEYIAVYVDDLDICMKDLNSFCDTLKEKYKLKLKGVGPINYHQKIRVHFVFDVKHCRKFKARLVADGHLTKEPMETAYSGVVSIRNLRLACSLQNSTTCWKAL